MDVSVRVQADGAVEVTEQFLARFDAAPATTFRRHVPRVRHEGVSDVVAVMDGGRMSVGTGPGTIQLGTARDLDVTWSFPYTSKGTRTFVLRYRAAGVVAVAGLRGRVSWLALPADRSFDAEDVRVAIQPPQGASFAGDPWVEEAGWTVERHADSVSATRARVARSESATMGVEFTIAHQSLAEPHWQHEEKRAAEFVPAFAAAGGFIIVVGLGVLAMMRLRFSRGQLPPEGDAERRTVGDERTKAVRDLRRAGAAVLVLGAIAWVVTGWRLASFGPWAYAVAGSVILVGLIFVAAAPLAAARRLPD